MLPTRFTYHTEPLRSAVIVCLALALVGLLPSDLLRVLCFSSAGGVVIWMIFQVLRKDRGVTLTADRVILVEDAHRRRRRTQIAYDSVQGCAITKAEGLVIAYRPPAPPPLAVPALTAARPEPSFTRLLVTPALDNSLILRQVLTEQLSHALALSDAHVLRMASRRRLWRWLLALLAIFGIPFYMYAISRLIAFFR